MPPSLITRTTLIDDDGSDTTGTIIDNNELQKIYDAIDQLSSGAGTYTTFEYGGNLKVDGILTANGIAPISGNANISGNLLVTGRLQVGGTVFGQATFPSFRAGTLSPGNQVMMEVTTGDNAAWAGVRAACFISTAAYNNLADLTVTGGVALNGPVTINNDPIFRGYTTIFTRPGTGDCSLFLTNTVDPAGSQTFRVMSYNQAFQIWGDSGGPTVLLTLNRSGGLNLAGGLVCTTGSFSGAVDHANNRLTRATLQGYSEVLAYASVPGNGYAYCDMSAANHFIVTYDRAHTFVFQNPPPGVSMLVLAIFGGGAAFGTGWYGTNGNGVRWPAGVAPTVSIVSGRADFLTFYTYDGGANWWGFVSGQNL